MTTLEVLAPAIRRPDPPIARALAHGWAVLSALAAAAALLGSYQPPWSANRLALLGVLPAGVLDALVLALAAVTLAALHTRGPRTGATLLVVGSLTVGGLADLGSIQFLGYGPMLVLALFGVGPAAGLVTFAAVSGPALSLAASIGGLAVAWTGGRRLAAFGVLRDVDLARWGRRAAGVAVVVPAVYAVTRIAWALGIPLGVRSSMLEDLGSMRYVGLGLALFACVGAWLTTGLVAGWGERFWSWLPVLGGRRVPVLLAVLPALFVAGTVISGGLSFWRLGLTGRLGELPGSVADWAAWVPEMLWPIWGVSLATAALGYAARRTQAGR